MREPIEVALSELPNTWERTRLCYAAETNPEALPEHTDPDYEFVYIDIGSVGANGTTMVGDPVRFSSSPSRARRLVRDGDVIVSTVRTYLRAVTRVRSPIGGFPVVVSTGFAVFRALPSTNPDFLYWWLMSDPFIEQVVSQSVGVSYPAINASAIAHMPMPLPPSNEQAEIADFLNRECKAIDQLVAELGAGQSERSASLSSLLQERRRALIAAAVTGKKEVA